MTKSKSVLHSYSGNIIKPVVKCKLLCEFQEKFDVIEFEIIDNNDDIGKPGLLGLKDVKLGLIHYDDRVNVMKSSSGIFKLSISDLPQPLQKESILHAYSDVFTGFGNLGQPVSFVLDPNVVQVYAPVHRIPLAKHKRTKQKIDEMVKAEELSKVDQPTDWCSNTTVVENVKQ